MLQINTTTTNNTITQKLAELRQTEPGIALRIRKVYEAIKCAEFTEEPLFGADLAIAYTGSMVSKDNALEACEIMLEWIDFIEAEVTEYDIPDVEIPKLEDRFAFLDNKEYADMTAYDLYMWLFHKLGTELEQETMSLNIGLKDKLDMLDELKALVVENFPNIRKEELTARLANALAITKQERGSSLALAENGNLALYEYLSTNRKAESKNMQFLADLNANKTAPLDILILKSAVKSYKAEVAKKRLPVLPKEFNLAVANVISNKQPLTEESKNLVKGMF